MAFTVVEEKLIKHVGEEGLAILVGTATSDGGSTGGAIKPGANSTNVSGSAGCKRIIGVGKFTPESTSSSVKSVKSFDATQGGDILTITTAANEVVGFEILCEYAGTAS